MYSYLQYCNEKSRLTCVVFNIDFQLEVSSYYVNNNGSYRWHSFLASVILTCFVSLQTGAMKLGRDALVLTQTSNSRSVALLSQSYNESKEVNYVFFYSSHGYLVCN